MTTIADLPLGAKVKLGTRLGQPIVWNIISKDHWTLDDMYPNDCATLWSEKILRSIVFDAKEPNSLTAAFITNGRPNYEVSNIRQWLNSNAEAGFWYEAQHSYDAPPNTTNVTNSNNVVLNPYDDAAGFLNEWINDHKSLIVDSTIISNGITLNDKIFLLAAKELGFNDDQNAERAAFPYLTSGFNNSMIRKNIIDSSALPPSQITAVVDGSYSHWTRSLIINSASTHNVISVTDYPGASFPQASNGNVAMQCYGVVPACNIPLSTPVSSTIDADGCYTLILPESSDPQEPEIIVDGDAVSLDNLARSNQGIIKRLTGTILTAAKSLFASKVHAHTFDNIDGILPVEKGGTGGTSISADLIAGALPPEKGGTGVTSLEELATLLSGSLGSDDKFMAVIKYRGGGFTKYNEYLELNPGDYKLFFMHMTGSNIQGLSFETPLYTFCIYDNANVMKKRCRIQYPSNGAYVSKPLADGSGLDSNANFQISTISLPNGGYSTIGTDYSETQANAITYVSGIILCVFKKIS